MNSTRKTKRNTATFAQLIDSLSALCAAEKNGGVILSMWVRQAVGGYADAQVFLPQVIARTENPVIAMLAKMAMGVR